MQETEGILFTDGSSRGNPGPGGWGTIMVWEDTVTELGGGATKTTNNRMELTAVLEGLRHMPMQISSVAIYTDSSYVLKGATQWAHGWSNNGWVTKAGDQVANRDVWERLMPLVAARKIVWHLVPGHVGVPGNERVDAIATAFADAQVPTLYTGPRATYPISLAVDERSATAQEKKSRTKMKAYSYLSYVNGVAVRHTTWAQCEARVRGVAGAKYRKATSLEDELSILDTWNVTPADVERDKS